MKRGIAMVLFLFWNLIASSQPYGIFRTTLNSSSFTGAGGASIDAMSDRYVGVVSVTTGSGYTTTDPVVVFYDKNTFLPTNAVHIPIPQENIYLSGVAIEDTVYMTMWNKDAGGDNAFLLAVDKNGNVLYSKMWHDNDDQPISITKDNYGFLYLTGSSGSSSGGGPPPPPPNRVSHLNLTTSSFLSYVIKFDPSTRQEVGNIKWGISTCDYMREGGNVYVSPTGSVYDGTNCNYFSYAIAKISNDLSTIDWAYKYYVQNQDTSDLSLTGPIPGGIGSIYGMVQTGNLLIVSAYYDAFYSGGRGSITLPSLGGEDIMLFALDTATGDVVWSKIIGTGSNERAARTNLIIDPSSPDSLYLLANINGDILIIKFSASTGDIGNIYSYGTASATEEGAWMTYVPGEGILITGRDPSSKTIINMLLPMPPSDLFCHSTTTINELNVTLVKTGGKITSTLTEITAPSYSSTPIGLSQLTNDTICALSCDVSITSQTDVSCYGLNNGSASATWSANAVSNVTWSTGAINATNQTNLPANSYWVAIEALSCTDTAYFTINQPDSLSISATVNDETCSGQSNGSINLSTTGGTPPYSYSWTPISSTSPNLTNLSPGTYTVTITDANGCTKTRSFVVDSGVTLQVSGTVTDESCFGASDGAINISVSGGNVPYTYSWNPPVSTSNSASNLAAGTYIVTISDATGCVSTDTFIVNGGSSITVTDSVIHSTDCANPNGEIIVNASGPNPPFTYQWNTGATTSTISGLGQGTYTVTIIDNIGCQETRTYIINAPNPPQLIMTANDVKCAGDSSGSATAMPIGGMPPYSYQWNTGDTTPTINNIPAGTYIVTITDAYNCSTVDTVTVNEPTPITIAYSNHNDPTTCISNDGWIVIKPQGGTPPYYHYWSHINAISTTDSIYNLPAGTYTDSIIDNNGCSFTVTITLENPQPQYSYDANVDSCLSRNPLSLKVSVSVSGGIEPYTVTWLDNNVHSKTTTVTDTGWVYFEVFDATGCKTLDSIHIVAPPPLSLSISPQIDTVPMGDSILLSASITGQYVNSWWQQSPFLWAASETEAFAFPIQADTFYFYAQDQLGCLYIDSVILFVKEGNVYFPTIFTPNGDGIHDTYGPVVFGKINVTWRIYNRWGQLIFEGDENSRWDGTFNGKPQEPDQYVLIAYIRDSTGKPIEKRTIPLYLTR